MSCYTTPKRAHIIRKPWLPNVISGRHLILQLIYDYPKQDILKIFSIRMHREILGDKNSNELFH